MFSSVALPLSGAILLGSSFVGAPPAVAQQTPERCYVHNDPDDSFPLTEEAFRRLGRIPATTAADAASDPAKLPDFAREVKNYIQNWKGDVNEWGIGRCILAESPVWNSGSIYVATIRPDGYVTYHAKRKGLFGRKIKANLLNEILITVNSDPASGGKLGSGGYVINYGIYGDIIIVGRDIDHSELDSVSASGSVEPAVRADQVVDRETLKAFVKSAANYINTSFALGTTKPFEIAQELRKDNGRWNHDSVYLFVVNKNGRSVFHGAFPSLEDLNNRSALKDAVTGELILPKIIQVAQGPDGGFVTYNYDDPATPDDKTPVPKVTFAMKLRPPQAAEGALRSLGWIDLILAAGIYDDPVSQSSAAATKDFLARFGSVAAGQTVELISNRMNTPASAGMHQKLAGQTISVDSSDNDLAVDRNHAMGVNTKGANHFSKLTINDLLVNSSFHVALGQNDQDDPSSGRWSAWGGAEFSSFTYDDTTDISGDVTTGVLGVDYQWDRTLTGMAVSHSRGNGSFENAADSAIETTLTSIHPYLHYAPNDQFSLWGILGAGRGRMELDEQNYDQTVETDLAGYMGALGLKRKLGTVEERFDLAFKTDLVYSELTADAADKLDEITVGATRLRALLESTYKVSLENGGLLRIPMELGLRYDDFDGEGAMKVEAGLGTHLTLPRGLSMSFRARHLFASGNNGGNWGVGGFIRFGSDQSGRGLALTLEPTIGNTVSQSPALYGIPAASRLYETQTSDTQLAMRAEVSYGLDANWGGLVTPFAGVSTDGVGGVTYRLGSRLRMAEDLNLSLETNVDKSAEHDDASYGILLRCLTSW